jgi:type I restriction enzyme S subunit
MMFLDNTIPIRRIADMHNGGTPTADAANWGGTILWATPRDIGRVHGGYLDSTERTITEVGSSNGAPVVPPGSVILSTRAPVGYIAITTEKMAFNQGCRALVPRTSVVSSQYLSYALQSSTEQLKAAAQGTTFLELSGTSLSDIRVPLPPRGRQQLIVDFLDRETAEIDAFIADQERLIELLDERRVATITHAVIKGLDPNAPMKDSGLEWVGQIPEHWRMMPIKRTASIRGRIGFRGYTTADLVDDGSGAIALSPGNMREGRLRWENSTYISWEKYFESPEIVVSSGDTLLVKTGSTFGKTAYVELSEKSHVTINPQIVILRPYCMDSYFFHCSISNSRVHNEFRSYPTGGTTPTMTESRIGSIEIAVPDYKEQRAIADFLKRETAELDAAISDAREAIALSRERRAALISAAVTGQLDVSQVQRPVEKVLEDEVRV